MDVCGIERGAKADADATSMRHAGRNFMLDILFRLATTM
jgi:hypothetical protein